MNTLKVKSVVGCVAEADAVLLVPITALILFLGNLEISMCLREGATVGRLLLGGAGLAVGTLVLWATVTRWARWVPAFMGMGALKALYSTFAGTMFSFPDRPLSRVFAALAVVCAGLAAILSWRFVDNKPEGREKAALLVFMVSTYPVLFFDKYPVVLVVSAVAALSALALGRLTSTSNRAPESRKRRSRAGASDCSD